MAGEMHENLAMALGNAELMRDEATAGHTAETGLYTAVTQGLGHLIAFQTILAEHEGAFGQLPECTRNFYHSKTAAIGAIDAYLPNVGG